MDITPLAASIVAIHVVDPSFSTGPAHAAHPCFRSLFFIAERVNEGTMIFNVAQETAHVRDPLESENIVQLSLRYILISVPMIEIDLQSRMHFGC